mmetsp:Transcript_15956/g.28776  ORF Transcript_15956/g.28776 Transcript_15956/m.28776 type:complete len:82 (+) Transcript_15956:816-1061(+)
MPGCSITFICFRFIMHGRQDTGTFVYSSVLTPASRSRASLATCEPPTNHQCCIHSYHLHAILYTQFSSYHVADFVLDEQVD